MSAKWRPFCLGLDVLILTWCDGADIWKSYSLKTCRWPSVVWNLSTGWFNNAQLRRYPTHKLLRASYIRRSDIPTYESKTVGRGCMLYLDRFSTRKPWHSVNSLRTGDTIFHNKTRSSLMPFQYQTITCTSALKLSIWLELTHFSEIAIKRQNVAWKCIWKSRPQNGGNVVQSSQVLCLPRIHRRYIFQLC